MILYCIYKQRTQKRLNLKTSFFLPLKINGLMVLQYLLVFINLLILQYNTNTIILLNHKPNKDKNTLFFKNTVFLKFIYKYSVNLKRFLCKYQKITYQILHLTLTPFTTFTRLQIWS